MGASSGQEPRMSKQEMEFLLQNMKYVGENACRQTRQYGIQSQQYSQQYIDNQKINFILENQKILGYRINPYSLTRNELDFFYNKLYSELEEYYAAQGY